MGDVRSAHLEVEAPSSAAGHTSLRNSGRALSSVPPNRDGSHADPSQTAVPPARTTHSKPGRKSLYVLASFKDVFERSGIDPSPGGRLAFPDEPVQDDLLPDPPDLSGEPSWTQSADNAIAPNQDPSALDEEIRFTLRDDLRELFPALGQDALSVITWKNAVILGIATGGVIAIREDLDGQVRDETAEHPSRWGSGSQFLRLFGNPEVQVPVMAAVYGYSLWEQDDDLHNFSKAMICAHALASITTITIKGIADTRRPDTSYMGGRYGFPSYHTSSSFAIASTIESYYGWRAGLPAYTVAGLVGWSRIDQREHDLSDVLFGAVLGYVIGKSVSAAHQERDARFEIQPYFEPSNCGSGVSLMMPY